jgi:cation diffusion facilitator CzcD-associated flavoprotein CzcO
VSQTELDAVIVGAGFGGIHALYELKQRGLDARLVDDAPDVGGTWYWNRYPGARTDSESWVYCFSFSKELCDDWDWKERYPAQPEVQAYLGHVADRFDLRRHMQFETRVESARYDERSARWLVTTSRGEEIRCRFFVLATGPMSRPIAPPFEGLDTFEGESYLTARWPTEEVDLAGKRVGMIGVGATGIQVVPVLAGQVGHLTVFQRTPNYVIEAGNRILSEEERQSIKDRYDELWTLAKRNPGGYAMEMPATGMQDFSPERVQEILEEAWAIGGFTLFQSFNDVTINPESNEVLCDFIRKKIHEIVEDPATAELLSPRGYPFGAKRPPLGHGYYAAFNNPNVELVDVADDPIERITPRGLRTANREFELDVLIFGMGFDASTGSLMAIDIRGRDGEALADRWADGPHTYVGACVDGFPNLFMVAGPQSPFANIPVVIDHSMRFITSVIDHELDNGVEALDVTPEAVQRWGAEADMLLDLQPILKQGAEHGSFFVGANVPGKPQAAYFYFGGAAMFDERMQAEVAEGFPSFVPVEVDAAADGALAADAAS